MPLCQSTRPRIRVTIPNLHPGSGLLKSTSLASLSPFLESSTQGLVDVFAGVGQVGMSPPAPLFRAHEGMLTLQVRLCKSL